MQYTMADIAKDSPGVIIERFLRWMVGQRRIPEGYRYNWIEDFVLRHGIPYEYQPLPSSIAKGPMKGCFRNAYRLSKREGLTYVEGYGMDRSGLITLHAWCAAESSRVAIDPTWDSGMAYLGVPFEAEVVEEIIRSRRRRRVPMSYSMLDDPPKFGLLRADFQQTCKAIR